MQSYQPESLSEFQISQPCGKPISHLEDILAKVIPVRTTADCVRVAGTEMEVEYVCVYGVCFGVKHLACEQLSRHVLY